MKLVQVWEKEDGKKILIPVGEIDLKIKTDENFIVTEYGLTDNYVELDEWDERAGNPVTGGIGQHARVWRVIEEDGIPLKNIYLIEYWSQWQGVLPSAEIIHMNNLPNKLRQLGRDPNKYIQQIKKL